MHTVYLILGSNLGDSRFTLLKANSLIEKRLGEVVKRSSIYQTAPWGVIDQPDYLNQVIQLKTVRKPEELIEEVLNMENKLGRTRLKKWEARIIDIDVLFYDNVILDRENLTIPHPLLHLRKFVLEPLAEIAPDLIHPVIKRTIRELLANLEDQLAVMKKPK